MSALRPSRILMHPVWWVALAVLLFNDHLFKGGGWLPPGITGKLSDFVGLLVAPALLAVLCRVRTDRGLLRAHIAVALGFAAINLSPALAAWVETVTAATPFPWRITVDPSDLIALPMAALSYTLFLPWSAAPVPVQRVVGRAGFGLGMLACVATSPPPPEPGPIGQNPGEGEIIFPTENAALMITNDTGVAQRVRVRRLRPEVRLSCDAVTADPSRLTQRDWFAPAELWSLEAGRALPLAVSGACTLYLIDGGELPPRLVFLRWLDNAQLSTDANAVEPERRIGIGMPSGTAEWGEHPALYPAPSRTPEEPEGLCRTIPDGFGLDWSEIPFGTRRLVDITHSPDGCTALDFEAPNEGSAPVRWFVCSPIFMPFAADDTLTLNRIPNGLGVEIIGPDERVVLSRGALPALDDVTETNYFATDCAPSFGCGLEVPVQVQLAHTEGPPSSPIIGEPLAIAGGELTIVRAQQRLVIDGECTADVTARPSDILVESVFVEAF